MILNKWGQKLFTKIRYKEKLVSCKIDNKCSTLKSNLYVIVSVDGAVATEFDL